MSFPFDPFAGLNRHDKCDNGYTANDLAETAHNTFIRIVGDNQFVRNTQWNQLPSADGDPWLSVAEMAIGLMDAKDQAEASLSVSHLARSFYMQFTAEMSAPRYDELPQHHQVAWQAIVRHLANIIDSDGPLNLSELEERITNWARERISGPQLVLS